MKDKVIAEALSKQGLKIELVDGEVLILPTVIKLRHLQINTARKGVYKVDPSRVPPELQEENLLWISKPPEYVATTENGELIPVFIEDGVTHNHEEIRPGDEEN